MLHLLKLLESIGRLVSGEAHDVSTVHKRIPRNRGFGCVGWGVLTFVLFFFASILKAWLSAQLGLEPGIVRALVTLPLSFWACLLYGGLLLRTLTLDVFLRPAGIRWSYQFLGIPMRTVELPLETVSGAEVTGSRLVLTTEDGATHALRYGTAEDLGTLRDEVRARVAALEEASPVDEDAQRRLAQLSGAVERS